MSTPNSPKEKTGPGRPRKKATEGSIGARVRKLREDAGLEPEEFGSLVGLKEKMVYRGEQKSNFSPAVLINIAQLFNDDLGERWLREHLNKIDKLKKDSMILYNPDEIELILFYRTRPLDERELLKQTIGMYEAADGNPAQEDKPKRRRA